MLGRFCRHSCGGRSVAGIGIRTSLVVRFRMCSRNLSMLWVLLFRLLDRQAHNAQYTQQLP